MPADQTIEFICELIEPVRLDVLLVQELEQNSIPHTRSKVQQLIKAGCIRVDNAVMTKPAQIVSAGAHVSVTIPEESSAVEACEIPISILYQDESVLVINKQAGLAMHPGAGNRTGTLANAIAAYLRDAVDTFPGGNRPGIVHRLDKDTTGILVVARTAAVHAHLSAQFSKRTTRRTYQALVAVTPRANRLVQREDSGIITTQLGRHPADRKKQAVLDSGGRKAMTHWKRIDLFHYAALVELRLETGRTHQIRVHMDSIRSPVIGDKTYGHIDFLPDTLQLQVMAFGRQALHAASLGFTHPLSGEELYFEAPLPDAMEQLVTAFKNYEAS